MTSAIFLLSGLEVFAALDGFSGVQIKEAVDSPKISLFLGGSHPLEFLSFIAASTNRNLFITSEAREKLRSMDPMQGVIQGDTWDQILDKVFSAISARLEPGKHFVFLKKDDGKGEAFLYVTFSGP